MSDGIAGLEGVEVAGEKARNTCGFVTLHIISIWSVAFKFWKKFHEATLAVVPTPPETISSVADAGTLTPFFRNQIFILCAAVPALRSIWAEN